MNFFLILFSFTELILSSNSHINSGLNTTYRVTNETETLSGNLFRNNDDFIFFKGPDTPLPKNKKLAVLLGVDNYRFIRPTTTSVNSVKDLDVNLKEHGYETMIFTDFTAKDFFIDGMKDFRERTTKENYDVVLFYLSGHFDAISEDEFFLLTGDCNPVGNKFNYLVTGTIQLYNLAVKISTLKSKIKILLFDGPNNIELPGGTEGKKIINNVIKSLGTETGLLISSGICDYSSVSKNGNGEITLYTEAIINSLNTPNLSLTEAFDYINNYMKQKSGGKFIPTFNNSLPGSISNNFCFSCK